MKIHQNLQFIFQSVLLASVLLSFTFSTLAVEYVYQKVQGASMSTDSIIVAGQIRNISNGMPKTFIINECDISHRTPKELGEVDENGYFSKKIPFSFPHTFTVNYNLRNFINAFAAPGDSIFMDIDAFTFPLKVEFSGDNAEISNQYNAAFQELSDFYNRKVELPADTVAIEEYMPVFKYFLEEGRKLVDSYVATHGISEDVKSMLYTDNTYTLANLAYGYRGRNMDEKRAFFLDPVFDIFNEDNTKVMIFPYHLSAIMNYFEDVRDNAPKCIIRDLMYACDEEVPTPDRSVFFNQKYYDRIYAKSNETKSISIEGIKGCEMLVCSDGEIKEIVDENPLEWLIKEYSGHPIYLDVSATWCGPCRAGLRESESLRNYFKDSDIRFAVIWLRSEKEEWLKAAPTISNALQLFVENAETTNTLTKQLNVIGFPSYYMIDKDGDIAKDGVPGYLSPELPDFLNKYKKTCD